MFLVAEGLMKQENTDENRRLWRGKALCVCVRERGGWGCSVGSSLRYNLASGTALHCLLRESAESTDPDAQPRRRAGTQTHAYTSSRARTEAGIIIAIRSPQKPRLLIVDEYKDAIFGPTSLFP